MYDYEKMKKELFTESGQVIFLNIRDNCQKLLAISGAFNLDSLMRFSSYSNGWMLLACIDRLVELGELKKVYDSGISQLDVYVGTGKSQHF